MNNTNWEFLAIIEMLPGYISAIDLNLRYIAVNPNLREFASEKNLQGTVIDCEVGCTGLPEKMQRLVNSPAGTEESFH